MSEGSENPVSMCSLKTFELEGTRFYPTPASRGLCSLLESYHLHDLGRADFCTQQVLNICRRGDILVLLMTCTQTRTNTHTPPF